MNGAQKDNKRVYEILVKAPGRGLTDELKDTLDVMIGHAFSMLKINSHFDMMLELRKTSIKYSAIFEEASHKEFRRVQEYLKRIYRGGMVLVDRGPATSEDYAKLKANPITFDSDNFDCEI